MMNACRIRMLDSQAPNPSVETLLHAFLPHKFIEPFSRRRDSCHSSINRMQAALCQEVFGDTLAIVPYIMPGFDLAKLAAKVYESIPRLPRAFAPTTRVVYIWEYRSRVLRATPPRRHYCTAVYLIKDKHLLSPNKWGATLSRNRSTASRSFVRTRSALCSNSAHQHSHSYFCRSSPTRTARETRSRNSRSRYPDQTIPHAHFPAGYSNPRTNILCNTIGTR